MADWLNAVFDPRVSRHLISDEGEIVVDEVRRHVVAYVVPVLIMLAGVLIMVATLWVPVSLAWLPLLVGLAVLVVGGYRVLETHMDRFVITNMRVFRVHGVLSQHTATMPMSRILDISVHKPFIGRIFRFGHFVFESAAQDQGLRDIRYVARPDERDLTIQRVIQRSGLRSSMHPIDPVAVHGPRTGPSETGPSEETPPERESDSDELEVEPYDPGPAATDPEPLSEHDADLEWLHSGSERDQAEHERALRTSGGSDLDGSDHDWGRSTEQEQE